MRVMSTPYEHGGRSAQKARTREALVVAARDLIAGGATPTVDAAAAAASISRTTAYRYFPSQRALLVAAHPEVATRSLLPEDPPADVVARLDSVVRNFTAMIIDTEAWRVSSPTMACVGSSSASAPRSASRRWCGWSISPACRRRRPWSSCDGQRRRCSNTPLRSRVDHPSITFGGEDLIAV
jgi:hypothetical protein